MIQPDDREARIQQWMRHRGTPPIVASPEWEEAQRRLRMGGQGNPVAMVIQQLLQLANQRRQPTLRDYTGGINPYGPQGNPYSI